MDDVSDEEADRGDSRLVLTVDDLFRAEFPRLVRALAVVDGPEAAADAVQEAFIQADRRWRRVQTMDDPAGWVRRVALNRLLNGRRTNRRRAELLASVRPVVDDELDPLDLDLLSAVGALPRQQRLAVCLHYLGGYPVADVAADLGIAAGTVKSHLFDARRTLRQRMEVSDG
jgi:RNA polymerase sigma-70 factor (ECF subfamily)